MVSIGIPSFLLLLSSALCLIGVSFGYTPVENYLISCGSSRNNSVGNRVFVADKFYANILSTPFDIFANTTNSSSVSSTYDPVLSQTARIFNGTSLYTFPITKHGRYWIRLHFFPFAYRTYNLSIAKFSVSAQNFNLFKEYQLKMGYDVREYSVNVATDRLVLTFTPSANSFAFVNALEVFSLPDELIPEGARSVSPQGNYQNLWNKALETVQRVNMGNLTVYPQNDTMWRLWVSDDTFLKHGNLAQFVSNIKGVNSTIAGQMQHVAPLSVYGTATGLFLEPKISTNVTWLFDVDPDFDYLVRFHFCHILAGPFSRIYFNVYLGSSLVYENLNLLNVTKGIMGAPYFMDATTSVSGDRTLRVSVGPSVFLDNEYQKSILNGLEIMKISNSRDSLDALDSVPLKRSKVNVILMVGIGIGIFVVVLVGFVLWRKRKLAHTWHLKSKNQFAKDDVHDIDSNEIAMLSTSTFGYRFPFVAIQEATDNFSESSLIGVGGFGKVYKGVLRDGTMVAVKRGVFHSQGVAEFRTEIEMLSQFRHRHLVSLIGYCDERNEMIIIYEYMENGTLKEHLYGSNRPGLSWRQRLEICIGAAKGLHYLHTGSARAIIHRDVKSANILLDEKPMAKVADFGLSKTGPEIDQTHVSTAVKGSFGYLDPEYLVRQKLTAKSDVYSFGVVMLEVLSGRPVIDPSLPREKVNLVEWATKCKWRGKMEETIDPLLEGQIEAESLKKFRDIAEKCMAESGVDRPSMGDVLWNLECALQLQENEQKSGHGSQCSTHINRANSFQASVSTGKFSVGSDDDASRVSMSRLFAEMVREEMR
uniref:Protein kinase domain-containing protein n=1 Tax=Rhizophora mucronata TaxID=61149 RepID=A0A2P2QM11_RHIMU